MQLNINDHPPDPRTTDDGSNPSPRLPFARPPGGIARPIAIWLAVLLAGTALHAADPLTEWRDDAGRIRILAENDAPRAYAEVQRLESTLPAGATPADRARALNLQARIEIYLARTDEAAQHIKLASELARQHGDAIGQAEADLNECLNSVNQGRIDDLITAATHSLTALEGVDRPDLLGEALLRAAMMYRRVGKIDESVTMCLRAMEIARRSGNPLALAYAHQGLAISYDQSDRSPEAREHYRQMREQAQAARSKLLEAYALSGLASSNGKLHDIPAAESFERQALAIFRAAGTPFNVGFGLFALAEIMRQQGRFTEALPLLAEVISIYERCPNRIGLWYSLNARSDNQLSLGDRDAALADAERAYALAKEIGFPLYLNESTDRLAKIAAARGDYKQAYEFEVAEDDLAIKTAREKISSQVVELAQRYETDLRQREIAELKHRNEQQTTELRQHELQQRWLWSVLGGSALALAGTAFFLVRLRRSHQMLETAHLQLRQSQTELQSQTRILQSVLDSMGDGVSVANEQGELLLVNPAAERIVGLGLVPGDSSTWTERYGLYLADRATPYPAADLPLARAVRGEPSDHVELFVRHPGLPEGRWLSVTARPLRDKTGAIHGGVAVFSDITARKHAEQEINALNVTLEQRVQERTAALTKSEGRFRLLFDTMLQGVVHQDPAGRIIFMNPAAERILGQTREEFVSQTSESVAHTTAREDGTPFPGAEHPAMVALQTGREVRNVVMGVRNPREQTTRWISVTATPLFRAGEDTPHEVYTIFDDITERRHGELQVKHLHEQLDARAQALEAANRELEAFCYSVSHDLRTPLRSIDGFSRVLLEDYADRLDDEGRDSLRRVRAASQRMGHLIDDLLQLSRTTRAELHRQPLDLTAIVRDIAGELDRAEPQRRVEWIIAPGLSAQGDDTLLRVALQNLLANAWKFTSRTASARIEFNRAAAAGGPEFYVRDNGVGFDMNFVGKLFGPFQRLHSSEEFPGTGVGLANVQRVIQRHGGRVWAEGRVGQGAIFHFTLPDQPEETP